MSMDLHGILNKNEYYTNHYFTTIFEENAADTISAWKQSAKDNETAAPWAAFRDTSKTFYRIRERYLQLRNESSSKELIESQAVKYLAALGYGEADGINIELNDEITVPVFHEVKKTNGAPLLWVLLSVAEERDDDILMGRGFGRKDADDEEFGIRLHENNDDVLAKLFFAGTEAPRWIILISINQIALIDRNKWDKKRYLRFDLEEIFSRHEETTFQALCVLLHRESLCPEEGNSLLDALDENSYKHSSSVSDSLKYALRECIELLGNEVLYDMRTRRGINLAEHPVDAGELTRECLRYMYRILFILFIEAREELGFAPMKSDVYQKGYSLEGVRDVCENVREVSAEAADGYYIHETISALFDMMYTGYPENQEAYREALKIQSPHGMFTIEPLKAHIFDPEYTKMLKRAKLRNVTMLKIVDLMSISRPVSSRERRGRISYSSLGINQMGAVYEALLSYRGFIAQEDLYEVKRAGDRFNELDVGYFVPERELDQYSEEERVRYEDYERKGKLRMYEKGTFIYRLAGREREKSASYYTPEILTKCLVKYALKELLKDKKADEILNLTICEPAMGSAAFLNEAISQLAEAYLVKKQEEQGEQIAFNERAAQLQRVKMFIADRNVYGVDLNPIAVELAEVSLWLNTIYKGAHVPWFGTQLICGNSLIGARRQVYHALKLQRGTWYNDEPEQIPEVMKEEHGREYKEYQRRRSGATYIYHFLLGDPGMANYTDKVIRDLEPENIEVIKKWRKEFCETYSHDDIEILNKLSDLIDDLWMRVIRSRQDVAKNTEESLSVYGHDEGAYEEHLTIREKDAIYNKIYKSEGGENASPYARLKAAMDYWCALWFWPVEKADLLPTRQEFFMELSLILEGGISAAIKKHESIGQIQFVYDEHGQIAGFGTTGSELANTIQKQISGLGEVNLGQIRTLYPRLQIANEIAKQQRFMHWELEFADLFYERGGFDLVIGNPPWIKYKWDEMNVLSDYEPLFVIKNYHSTQRTKRRNKLLANKETEKAYVSEYGKITGMLCFLNALQNYKDLWGVQTNLYKCFLPISQYINTINGVFSFVHPDGVFDDSSGTALRKKIYGKLRYHFHFINEKMLFKEVGHPEVFSLNVYCNAGCNYMEMIGNLFLPSTIEECFDAGDDHKMFGIKDDRGEWNIYGHPDRVIVIGVEERRIFANVFDGDNDPDRAKLPILHSKQLFRVIKCFSQHAKLDRYEYYTTQCFDETGAQGANILVENVEFPEYVSDFVYSGPHIGVGNPLFQTPRRLVKSKGDFDKVDLEFITSDYIQRSKYVPGDKSSYTKAIPTTSWGTPYNMEYRLLSRKMLNLKQERTLISAIAPKGTTHINGIFGVCFRDIKKLVLMSALMASLPYDYFIKCMGKTNLLDNNFASLPLVQSEYEGELMHRALLLNCLTDNYNDLWELTTDSEWKDSWAKADKRLNEDIMDIAEKKKRCFLKSDYERRQALIEIDVLVSISLGLSLEELLMMYRIQFPVLQSYESGTWYDQNGRIVFTNNRSLTNVGFARKEWEEIKDAKAGVFTKTITDDTMPGGPIERTIEYVAPFGRCDRKKDYEEVWAHFEKRFNR